MAKPWSTTSMMERFGITEVYGMHCAPGIPVGQFATRTGPLLAAADFFHITVEGKGSHAAEPHKGIDTLVVGANILLAFQSIVARNVDPMKSGVVTVGTFRGGHASNVIPQKAELVGTVRSLDPAIRDLLHKRVVETAEGIAAAYGAKATVDYQRNYPVTVNHPKETDFAVAVAREVAGADKVEAEHHADHGRRRFLVHAGGAAWQHDLDRQWRQRCLPSSRLRLRRFRHSARGQLLGASRRDRLAALIHRQHETAPSVRNMKIVFHGQNAKAFRPAFETLLEGRHDIASLPDVLTTTEDQNAFTDADIIIGIKLDASLPKPARTAPLPRPCRRH